MTMEEMEFPNTFDEFVKSYGFKDNEEVYTSGSELIPVFRVKQWLDHIKPCEDCVSRSELKRRLQEHHDFFVNAYGGFSNMPLNDKARVDEITNCIAEVVNMPSVQPERPKGEWINNHTQCSICEWGMEDDVVGSAMMLFFPYCPNCGAKMEGESE